MCEAILKIIKFQYLEMEEMSYLLAIQDIDGLYICSINLDYYQKYYQLLQT